MLLVKVRRQLDVMLIWNEIFLNCRGGGLGEERHTRYSERHPADPRASQAYGPDAGGEAADHQGGGRGGGVLRGDSPGDGGDSEEDLLDSSCERK